MYKNRRAWLIPHANESPKIRQRPHFPQYLLSDSALFDPFFPGAVNDGIRIFGVPGFDLTTEGLTSPVATLSARSFFAVVKTGAKGPINI